MDKKLKKDLDNNLNNYENLGLNDDGKAKGLAIIAKEKTILLAEKKQEEELKLRKEQQQLEREKFEFEKKSKEEQLDNDRVKSVLEREKFELELSLKKEEAKSSKRKDIIAIATSIGTFVVLFGSKLVYYSLAKRAQKYDYEEFKLESPSSKEQRNNLLNK